MLWQHKFSGTAAAVGFTQAAFPVSTQLNSSLLKTGSQKAKRDT